MKQVLEPLVRIPGVRLAALISDDGVPVAVLHNQGQEREAKEKDAIEAAEDFHSYAGLAAGWLSEATRRRTALVGRAAAHRAARNARDARDSHRPRRGSPRRARPGSARRRVAHPNGECHPAHASPAAQHERFQRHTRGPRARCRSALDTDFRGQRGLSWSPGDPSFAPRAARL